MEHLRNCYDAIHPDATQTIRIHAHRLARATLIPGMTAADYEQQLALDLWRRLPVYDPKRAALATFIDRVVRRRACDFLTAAQTAARRAERQSVSLDGAAGGEAHGEGPAARLSTADRLWGHADELEHDTGLRHDLGRFVAKLSPALKRCCAILTNSSIGEAVRKEGLHRSSHYEAVARLRRKAREAGLRDYLGDPDKSKDGSVSKDREPRARA
jgi:DNA-directed RNA polymerase specialized sigma24 family protein